MVGTVASLFTALLPHQGQRHTDWSDGTSSPEYKKWPALMADRLNSAPIWMKESEHQTHFFTPGNRNTRQNKSQNDLCSVLVVLHVFFSLTSKNRYIKSKDPISIYLFVHLFIHSFIYWFTMSTCEVHGPCLDMETRLVYDCLATMLFHLLPLEGCLPHAWSGAKRLHGNHDNGGTWGRGWLEGRFFFWRTMTLGRTGTGP